MNLNVTLMKSHALAFSEGTWYKAIAIVIFKTFFVLIENISYVNYPNLYAIIKVLLCLLLTFSL